MRRPRWGWALVAAVPAVFIGYFIAEWIVNMDWQIVSCNTDGSYTLANGVLVWPHDEYNSPIFELQP